MIIYHSEENKGNLLKFTKEMQKEIDEYRKQFMQEDTLAGTIKGGLIIIKEIMYVLFRFGVRLLITGIVSLRSMRQMKFVKSWILRLLDGSEVVIIDLPQKGMATTALDSKK